MRSNNPDRERHGRKSLQRQTTVLLVAVVSFFALFFRLLPISWKGIRRTIIKQEHLKMQ